MYFLKNDGTLWSYGGNEYGQCGNGEHGDFDYLTQDCVVSEPYKMADNVIDVYTIDTTVFYLTEDNKLYACGLNYNDLLLLGGNGQMNLEEYPKFTATPVLVMENVLQMKFSNESMYVLKTDNTLWTWGNADKGFLGNGVCYEGNDLGETDFLMREINGETLYSQPTQIMSGVERLLTQTSGLHFVEKTDGSIWYWGYGSIFTDGDDDWDTEFQRKDSDGNYLYSVYQKHYIIPTPIEFSVDTFFQNALDYIAAQGIDVSQYEAIGYTYE